VTAFDDLEQQRLDKVERLRARGVDPYPVRYDRTHTARALHETYDALDAGAETGAHVSVAGRLMLRRGHGKLGFGELRDATGDIQVMCALDKLGAQAFELWEDLDLGDWIGVEGEVIKTRKGELSVRASALTMLAKDIRPLPEKWHGLKDPEMRFRQRYLDFAINSDARQVAAIRSRAISRIREFMIERGYLEVETPMLQVQPGGAIAKPFVTHMNALNLDLYLRIAPELYLKRLLVGGFDRVFEINRNFRNEGLSTKHNPEFTMLEAYEAFGDYFTMMDLMESLIATVAKDVRGTTDLEWQGRALPLGGPIPRRRLIDLAGEAAGATLDLDMPLEKIREIAEGKGVPCDPAWGQGKIVVEIYEKLVEPNLFAPTFVMDFPRETSPLAKAHRDDPRFTEHFDLVMAGIEIGPAYSELNDPIDQRRRFEDQVKARAAGDDEAMSLDEDFLRALEYGMPPTGGMGFGIDRFVMLLADAPSIRETMLFPLMRPEGSPQD
jgi:lysyl-tRNA synthetase class 2